jgi:hypothetical protein
MEVLHIFAQIFKNQLGSYTEHTSIYFEKQERCPKEGRG